VTRSRSVAPREFLLDGTWESAAALATLESRLAVAERPPRAVRRVWLDTFDWRLHRAGLALEQLHDGAVRELALLGPGGERILALLLAEETLAQRWPGPLDRVPAGRLRERLRPVVGVRALLPLVGTAGVLHDLSVLNADEKTVVRLTVDRSSVTEPFARALAPRLLLVPVRGYGAEANRVARLLASLPRVAAAAESGFEAALAAVGRRAGDDTGSVEIALNASTPAATALATVLLHLLDTAEANLGGVLDDLDTEFLHDLRVAVRRTRSALKLAGDVLPDGLAERFAPEFKWLGDRTTPTRDLDVYLLAFGGGTRELAPFRVYLQRRRQVEHRRLVRALRSARFATLLRDWRAALLGVSGPGAAAWTRPPVGELAATRVLRAYGRVVRLGSAITPQSPAEDLHDLRKRCKELRYLLELFASLHDPADHRRVVESLKALQDCLGEFQDCQVQRDAVRDFAERMQADGAAPPATLLAMGELAAQLDARQQSARRRFAERFARLTDKRSRRRVSALTGEAAA
jgi:CHAD domain-containing protein